MSFPSHTLNGKKLTSERKIEIYELHSADLYGDVDKQFIGLKRFVKKYAVDKHDEIFNTQSGKLPNYVAYSGYKSIIGFLLRIFKNV